MKAFVVRKVTPKKWQVFLNVAPLWFKESEYKKLGIDYPRALADRNKVTTMGVVTTGKGLEIKPVDVVDGEIRPRAGAEIVSFETKQKATDIAIAVMHRLGRQTMFAHTEIDYI